MYSFDEIYIRNHEMCVCVTENDGAFRTMHVWTGSKPTQKCKSRRTHTHTHTEGYRDFEPRPGILRKCDRGCKEDQVKGWHHQQASSGGCAGWHAETGLPVCGLVSRSSISWSKVYSVSKILNLYTYGFEPGSAAPDHLWHIYLHIYIHILSDFKYDMIFWCDIFIYINIDVDTYRLNEAWDIIDAQNFLVRQRRNRVWGLAQSDVGVNEADFQAAWRSLLSQMKSSHLFAMNDSFCPGLAKQAPKSERESALVNECLQESVAVFQWHFNIFVYIYMFVYIYIYIFCSYIFVYIYICSLYICIYFANV